MNKGDEEERKQRCKIEKKKREKNICEEERRGKKRIFQYETELARTVYFLLKQKIPPLHKNDTLY